MATCVVCKELIPDTSPNDEPGTMRDDVRVWICLPCVHAIAKMDVYGLMGTEPALQFIDLDLEGTAADA